MKLAEMLEIRDNRVNLQGFLHYSEQNFIQNLLDIDFHVAPSFIDICNIVLSMYTNKAISNKAASKCFEILAQANPRFKTECYRYNENTQELYKYSFNYDCYIFVDKCSKKVYKSKYANQYV